MKRLFAVSAIALLATGISIPALGQSVNNPVVITGADSTGYPIYSPIGTGSAGSVAMPVNASVTASIAGFTPTAGATANLSATTTSADVALPTGTDIVVTNSGSTDAAFRIQVGAGTAVTTDQIIKAGAAIGIHVGTSTHLSAITASGTTTLNIQGGTGLATGYGGRASGGVSSTNLSSTISVTNTFQSIQAATTTRKGCLIQNQSTLDPMWVFFGPIGSATKATSFELDSTHGLQISCSVGGLNVATDQVSITGTATDAFAASFQ